MPVYSHQYQRQSLKYQPTNQPMAQVSNLLRWPIRRRLFKLETCVLVEYYCELKAQRISMSAKSPLLGVTHHQCRSNWDTDYQLSVESSLSACRLCYERGKKTCALYLVPNNTRDAQGCEWLCDRHRLVNSHILTRLKFVYCKSYIWFLQCYAILKLCMLN